MEYLTACLILFLRYIVCLSKYFVKVVFQGWSAFASSWKRNENMVGVFPCHGWKIKSRSKRLLGFF